MLQRNLLILLLGLMICGMNAAVGADRLPVILLDPGHTPQQQGALGVRGRYELSYNDHFVAKLAQALRAASFTVDITRQPEQSLTLTERVALANNGQSALFLAIHHDSAQLNYLQKIQLCQVGEDNNVGESKAERKSSDGKCTGYGYQTTKKIGGYSVFVSQKNSHFTESYRFAELLGQSLLKLGRPPTLHHAEQISGENRPLLNQRLGIYRFDDLVVLAKSNIPAVLLEIGVIVDAEDESYVAAERNQQAMCDAIVSAMLTYFDKK